MSMSKGPFKVKIPISSMCQLLRHPTVQSSALESGRREMHFRRYTRSATGYKREKVPGFLFICIIFISIGETELPHTNEWNRTTVLHRN